MPVGDEQYMNSMNLNYVSVLSTAWTNRSLRNIWFFSLKKWRKRLLIMTTVKMQVLVQPSWLLWTICYTTQPRLNLKSVSSELFLVFCWEFKFKMMINLSRSLIPTVCAESSCTPCKPCARTFSENFRIRICLNINWFKWLRKVSSVSFDCEFLPE